MSDPYVTRQEPTEDSLISNRDPDMALHYVDRLDVGIDGATKVEIIDALRFWIGEADHYKNTRADSALVERLEGLVAEMKQQPAAYLSPRWGEELQQIIDEHALARKNG